MARANSRAWSGCNGSSLSCEKQSPRLTHEEGTSKGYTALKIAQSCVRGECTVYGNLHRIEFAPLVKTCSDIVPKVTNDLKR
jgi:hypothetical protein